MKKFLAGLALGICCAVASPITAQSRPNTAIVGDAYLQIQRLDGTWFRRYFSYQVKDSTNSGRYPTTSPPLGKARITAQDLAGTLQAYLDSHVTDAQAAEGL